MPPEVFEAKLIWPEVENALVCRANQFLTQINNGVDGKPEDIILTLGHVTPPVILGTDEEQREMAAAIGAVSVKTLSRVSLSLGQAENLAKLLHQAVETSRSLGGGA